MPWIVIISEASVTGYEVVWFGGNSVVSLLGLLRCGDVLIYIFFLKMQVMRCMLSYEDVY